MVWSPRVDKKEITFIAQLSVSLYKWSQDQWCREGGGNKGNVLPPRNRKNVVDIWCYLPEVILSELRAEIIENFREELWKKSIFHRDFDQKISNLPHLFEGCPLACNAHPRNYFLRPMLYMGTYVLNFQHISIVHLLLFPDICFSYLITISRLIWK